MDIFLKCSNCQKEFKKSEGFYMYNYKCCSDDCLRILRNQTKKPEVEPVRNTGAFTLSAGGCC